MNQRLDRACQDVSSDVVRFLLQYGNERLSEIQDENAGQEYISVAEYVINEILNDELAEFDISEGRSTLQPPRAKDFDLH